MVFFYELARVYRVFGRLYTRIFLVSVFRAPIRIIG